MCVALSEFIRVFTAAVIYVVKRNLDIGCCTLSSNPGVGNPRFLLPADAQHQFRNFVLWIENGGGGNIKKYRN
jgi:hypothetical protein